MSMDTLVKPTSVGVKYQLRDMFVILSFLVGLVLFNRLILTRFLPVVLVAVFLIIYYFFIRSRNKGNSFGLRLISAGFAFVGGFLINNLL